ncbi:MAG TPA: hybrid sensor histidine kinase/response regulator [Sediminispirochaeta sp.]|nr:hybrid sensor histidine kinase/response regulator [Sediminispirochaeta sp.]
MELEGEKRTVFVADDNPDNLRVLSDILEAEGYRTRASLTGEEMLKSISLEKPDLIILDVHMPGMDGYQVCTRLQSVEEHRDIPVVFCSALDESYNIVKGFEVGAVDYITKPFRAKEVLARIRTHIELHEKKAELEKLLEYTKSTQEHLVKTAKMNSIGVLMAGIAHEINNPINYIINSVEGFRRDFDEVKGLLDFFVTKYGADPEAPLKRIDYPVPLEEMDKLLTGIYAGSTKVHEIVKALRGFSKSGDEELESVDVEEEIDRAVLMTNHLFDSRTELVKNIENKKTLNIKPGRLSQVVLQLLENSLEAIAAKQGESRDKIILELKDDKDQEGFSIWIKDTGIGMSQEAMRRAFEPFYSDKGIGRHVGLGLTTAEHIVSDIGGKILIESTPGSGTSVRLMF